VENCFAAPQGQSYARIWANNKKGLDYNC